MKKKPENQNDDHEDTFDMYVSQYRPDFERPMHEKPHINDQKKNHAELESEKMVPVTANIVP
ncbi:MAG: hypothetical protein FWC50_00060 [Planctomycetaceae bacterium]|nr:hypothetical protein [Planctomycetaceae bacterium]